MKEVIGHTVQHIRTVFHKFGIDTGYTFSTDPNSPQEYGSSLVDIRSKKDFADDTALKSYTHLAYSYSAPSLSSKVPQNIALEAYRKLQIQNRNLPKFKVVSDKPEPDEIVEVEGYRNFSFQKQTRNLKDKHLDPIQIREAMSVQIPMQFGVSSADTDIMMALSFIILKHLRQSTFTIPYKVKVGGKIDTVEVEYLVSVKQIDDLKHHDTDTYGNLMLISFQAEVDGIVFSPFSTEAHLIETVTQTLAVKDKDLKKAMK